MIEGQTIVPALDRHAFRGEFLDCFALIEDHLVPAIDRAVELGFAKKPPHLFGQKFELARKVVDDERIWLHREHVRPIIDSLASYAEMRGLIGHGVIVDAVLEGRPALSIRPSGISDWRKRIVLSEAETNALLNELRELTTRFRKQALKAQAKRQN